MSIRRKRAPKLSLTELVAGLSEADRQLVEREHSRSPKPFFPDLPYTEASPEWIALHEHCKRGQLDPAQLRQMDTADLEYLAASLPSTDPNAVSQSLKLQANVTRATRELQHRYQLRITKTVTIVSASFALLGAVVGAVMTELI